MNYVGLKDDFGITQIRLVKHGNFHKVTGRDAFILSYLFNYKITRDAQGEDSCSFPNNTLNKVLKRLEYENISYICFNNYLEINLKNDFKEMNQYLNCYNKAYEYVLKKNRINKICDVLNSEIKSENFLENLEKIEKILKI